MPTTGSFEVTLAGVARWVGRNRDLVPGKPSSTTVWPVAHHPAACACATKFSRAYSHRMIPVDSGLSGLVPQEQSFADAVLQAGGSGT